MPTTWYVDPETGDNNNSGDSFAITLNGTTTVTNGTTTVTRAAGGFTGLEGRKIYFVNTAAGRTINTVTNDTACVVNATVGVATQNPALRSRFGGKPEYVINLMRFLAQNLRDLVRCFFHGCKVVAI